MATWTVTGHESLLSIAARRLRGITRVALQLVLRLVLVVAGLALLAAAAWLIAVPLGLAVAGVSCLVLEWAVKR